MTRKTSWDLHPNPKTKWYKFDVTAVECYKCKNKINGYIVLDRRELNVVDSSGFMIFDEPICDLCCGPTMNFFADAITEIAEDMGIKDIRKELGIYTQKFYNNSAKEEEEEDKKY